jgi:CrcB protein
MTSVQPGSVCTNLNRHFRHNVLQEIPMLRNILCVAAGGAIGAVLRYLISIIPFRTVFPFQTFTVNITGALIIGFITAFAVLYADSTTGRVPVRLLLLLKTGICGGFTTFSTFSLETVSLFEKGHTGTGSLYIAASLAAGYGAVLLGEFLAEAAVS